jgi:uncharacterized protein (TIGR02757 family)
MCASSLSRVEKEAERGVRPRVGRAQLEAIYRALNRREYVHPDPVEFLYRWENLRDREIAAVVASSLAYGRVDQILASVERVLGVLGPCPSRFLSGAERRSLLRSLATFKHRFTTGAEIVDLLLGARDMQARWGTMGARLAALVGDDEPTVAPALVGFAAELREHSGPCGTSLLPVPERGSACKRLHLLLRWLVRRDDVDPGGWEAVPASKLVVPLDTHMHRIARRLGLTARRAADLKTALEITEAFRAWSPEDPVKYDFALTRLGIRGDVTLEEALGLARGAR